VKSRRTKQPNDAASGGVDLDILAADDRLSIAEAARELKLAVPTVWRWHHRGLQIADNGKRLKLPATKLGRGLFTTRTLLLDFVRAYRVASRGGRSND